MGTTEEGRHNRLAGEMSPYLRQHARNPVDWYPWGEEAFARARLEDKPILLSIGYSTCHWCHVMAKECFSDPEIAELMNRYFINIKVDREERPDIDRIYMTAVSALTGGGGWPLNVFLTPDRKPFFGGTYFPPTPGRGMTSWPDLLGMIQQHWRNPERRVNITASAADTTAAVEAHLTGGDSAGGDSGALPDDRLIEQAFDAFAGQFDAGKGGFGPAPKFPSPGIQHFLFQYALYVRERNSAGAQQAVRMAVRTLDAMAGGGIHDRVGGGFHRYATDRDWHVPHFEKMLYDNAQLVMNYIDAFRQTGVRRHADAAEATIDYVLRDLRHPEGGFYSAEDADSYPSRNAPEKVEGAFYVWELTEIEAVLGPDDGKVFAFRHGVRPEGNVAHDPFGEFRQKNILYRAHSIEAAAREFGLTEDVVRRKMERSLDRLRQVRESRPRPHRDEKILTDWNALMISALARAGRFLNRPGYITAASEAAAFIFHHLHDPSGNRLFRAWRDGNRKGDALAADYAFLVRALLDLYEADFDPLRLKQAVDLNDKAVSLFMDTKTGGMFMTSGNHDPHLIMRVRDDSDNVTPSAASVVASNLLRLGVITGKQAHLDAGERVLAEAAGRVARHPGAGHGMLAEMCAARNRRMRVVIAGPAEDERTRGFIRAAAEKHGPGIGVLLVDGETTRRILGELVEGLPPTDVGETRAYMCDEGGCREPLVDIERFETLMGE